ncbi:carboxylase:pyruvate/acetyl-coa/propionyl-CoA [Crucibulum laeve]|uniref:Carboxylase:pyruvate/acetyl-coa/propionyl-CoA n=1 Tax=Crucibulum laeve TaxID=68775 RepID=A0A5C3M7M1_9AGAR|nr:carboxylase:pyruvate/acetyl-coa/propionyl-CoA [Crucibulum laeve]
MNVDAIIEVAVRTKCTHVHPGYGFLSENPDLSLALAALSGAPITFIGPSHNTLRTASDKMLSHDLATSLGVQVAPGTRVHSAEDVCVFGRTTSYPIMIKALDGGGGRGIRIVESEGGVNEAYSRCLGESPSKQVFAEKALTGPGWKHIEVQVIGDGTGAVNHFWERECSVQRRFQKIVESAPSRLPREAIQPLLVASLKIAAHIKYKGLGTFEYLVNTDSQQWVFLEINPRVQVEHTVTEEISGHDLVRLQLLLFTPSVTLSSLNLITPPPPSRGYAIQLRLTAEDPSKSFQLSPGKIKPQGVIWPAGRGVRIDTWLTFGDNIQENREWTVGTDFDSLLAKIITHAPTFEEANQKALRALRELYFSSSAVKTNRAVLWGVLRHPDWAQGLIDTLWLERELKEVLRLGSERGGEVKGLVSSPKTTSEDFSIGEAGSVGATLLQPGTLFNLTISPTAKSDESNETKHTLTLTSVFHNSFPSLLSGTLLTSFSPQTPYTFSLSQSTSASVHSSGEFELADPNNPLQIVAPMTGKVVEVHPALIAAANGANGKREPVKQGDPIIILSVMKMETVVSAPRDGWVTRIGRGVKVGVVIGEGMLVCVFGEQDAALSSKL